MAAALLAEVSPRRPFSLASTAAAAANAFVRSLVVRGLHVNVPFSRRRLLVSSGAAGALLALAGCSAGGGGRASPSSPAAGSTIARPRSTGGPLLVPAGPELALPEGFGYVVLQTTADGVMPPAPDGMAAFGSADGRVRLVRNHERALPAGAAPPLDPATAYDAGAAGGTTTVELTADLRTVTSMHVSLSGTVQNCSGGVTPHGTWLSCEETNEGSEAGRGAAHGYVFEVDPWGNAPAAPVRLASLGRFLHEAVAVDPASGVAYLTEDNGYDSGLYRFTPHVPGALADGGELQMLAITDRAEYDTSYDQTVGTRLPVSWVPIAEPDPPSAGSDPSAVFNQGLAAGGARFKRAEGCALVGAVWYVSVTEGGDAGLGQVWAYDVAAGDLRLVYEPVEPGAMFGPDALVGTPDGAGVLVAEDNGNGDPNRLHVLGSDGRLWTFAENVADTSEFAGLCWSPDGSTLFVNLLGDEAQGVPGRTLAMWGPWAALGGS